MAQPSSIQREPTMEEILASIRRIIEDSDPGAPKTASEEAHSAAEPAQTAAPQTAAPAKTAAGDETVAEVEAFRRDIQWDEPAAPASATAHNGVSRMEPPAAPKSLAELQSSLRDAPIEDLAGTVDEVAEPEALVEPWQPEEIAEEAAAEAAPQAETAQEAQAEASPAAETGVETRPSIISEQAGRQVAAAFEELSEAFAANRKRSFDEMAEEMIRPMLREWMDNNLPVLVERLVREEIERVARGA